MKTTRVSFQSVLQVGGLNKARNVQRCSARRSQHRGSRLNSQFPEAREGPTEFVLPDVDKFLARLETKQGAFMPHFCLCSSKRVWEWRKSNFTVR